MSSRLESIHGADSSTELLQVTITGSKTNSVLEYAHSALEMEKRNQGLC